VKEGSRFYDSVSRPAVKATLEHALLGLVAEIPGVSGYDIVKLFNLSMAHYWHAHQGQIYPTLERMEQSGLIKSREFIQRGRPNKRLYTITPAGQRMLMEWLQSPFEAMKIKYPSLLKCRFLGHLGADRAKEALMEERAAWIEHLKVYRDIERDYFANGKAYQNVDAMFSMFTLRRGIDWMEENIRWCEWAIGQIGEHRGLFAGEAKEPRIKRAVS
jgi:DNA-binding PadR family transcriptional regulator